MTNTSRLRSIVTTPCPIAFIVQKICEESNQSLLDSAVAVTIAAALIAFVAVVSFVAVAVTVAID